MNKNVEVEEIDHAQLLVESGEWYDESHEQGQALLRHAKQLKAYKVVHIMRTIATLATMIGLAHFVMQGDKLAVMVALAAFAAGYYFDVKRPAQ